MSRQHNIDVPQDDLMTTMHIALYSYVQMHMYYNKQLYIYEGCKATA